MSAGTFCVSSLAPKTLAWLSVADHNIALALNMRKTALDTGAFSMVSFKALAGQ